MIGGCDRIRTYMTFWVPDLQSGAATNSASHPHINTGGNCWIRTSGTISSTVS